ncbi:MAG: reverse transcriptase domain-containing protein, partial [Gammaproteobacteria bacterium]
SLLKLAFDENQLNHVRRKLKNDSTDWNREIVNQAFRKDFLLHILTLRRQVLEGSYRPSPLRQFALQRADGGHRRISTHYLCDKLAQKAVMTLLEPLGERIFHVNSYAYRPQRSVSMAVSKARELVMAGNPWIVGADIDKCFDAIPHKKLKHCLAVHVADKSLCALIALWIDQYHHQKSLFSTPCGISQGSVLSPFLCNLYLTSVDQYLERKGIPFVRYADNFLLATLDEKYAEKSLKVLKEALAPLHLTLNPSKTRVQKCNKNYRFLGQRMPEFKAYSPMSYSKVGT